MQEILKKIPELSFEDIGVAVYDFCLDHVNHFGCLPFDMAFNSGDDNEVIVSQDDFPIFVPKDKWENINKILLNGEFDN